MTDSMDSLDIQFGDGAWNNYGQPLSLEQKVNRLNQFIADQNYRVERHTGAGTINRESITIHITYDHDDNYWWVQNNAHVEWYLAHILDKEIKVYAVTEVDWSKP